jgi:hypothetical protein
MIVRSPSTVAFGTALVGGGAEPAPRAVQERGGALRYHELGIGPELSEADRQLVFQKLLLEPQLIQPGRGLKGPRPPP